MVVRTFRYIVAFKLLINQRGRQMDSNSLRQKFYELFNEYPTHTFSAAGRVNLIGEHIDYCGGRVLPAALSLKCTALVRKNGTNLMRIGATTIDARAEIDLNNTQAYKNLSWGNYQAGVADEMKKAGYNLVGCDILYDVSRI